MADMVLAVEYGSKRFAVKTVHEVDQVQKFLAEYKRLLTEQERVAQAEALLFSSPSAAPTLDQPIEIIPPVETAQPAKAELATTAAELSTLPDPLPAAERGRPPSTPPVGQRTVDYLLRALATGTGTMLKTEMLAACTALGWTTKARTKSSTKNTLYAAVTHSPDWIAQDRERIIITEAGRAFVQTLPPLPSVSNTPEAS